MGRIHVQLGWLLRHCCGVEVDKAISAVPLGLKIHRQVEEIKPGRMRGSETGMLKPVRPLGPSRRYVKATLVLTAILACRWQSASNCSSVDMRSKPAIMTSLNSSSQVYRFGMLRSMTLAE